MQSKGVVRFFLIALSLVCLYQFALMIPTNNVESKAKAYANECSQKGQSWQSCYSQYLDSVSTDTIFRFPGIKAYNYAELKKSQLALGLDLKGGMSVLLQVDLQDFLKNLAGNTTDPTFKAAIDRATEMQKTQQADYITLFAQAWRETSGGKSLASVFSRNEALKDKIKYDSPDADVMQTIRTLANSTVDETYKRLKQRIDKLGVIQPNVSLDAGRDLILVELPGIDNPERAREMLSRAAKLEFWETYRLGDEKMMEAFASADRKLKALVGGDSVQTQTVKDTTWTYPPGANGQPDSSQARIVDKVTDRIDTLQNQTAGPLFKIFYPNVQGGAQGPIIGWADKNQRDDVSAFLERPEIVSLFPANIKFLWGQKPVASGQGALSGKYELYAAKKFRGQETPRIDGSVVTRADEQPDPQGEITVSLSMNDEGAREWEKMTAEAYQAGQREIAIVLDNEVVSAPSVRGRIAGGTSSISGNFSLEEAQDLASILEVGKLPAGTHIVQESQVGPSLGAENIQKSLLTMILSVALLCVFMYAYYNKGGLVAVVALLANIFFIIGTLASLGTVLTLPGIAGIVLTLAAAIDANVIIFERIREEVRHGMSLRQAVSTGFSRAVPPILDANLAHALTAVVLIYFGLGPIKGFGTVLIIGVVTSLFTAVLVGRYITEWWLDRRGELAYSWPWSEKWLVGFHYDWMGKRKWAYIFSVIMTVIAVGSFFTRGFELGVDFKGGYSFNVKFDQPVDIEQLREPLSEALEGNPIIKAVNTENTYNITTSYHINEQGPKVIDGVIAKLHEGITKAGVNVPLDQFKKTDGSGTHITSSSQVGATVADDIRNSSFLSGAWALALIFLYLLVRFRRWQFSMGAILGLAHDVVITMGFFSLLHGLVPFSLEVDQAIIACVLTIIGFSVNDTVIVYDRIREFIHTYAGRPKAEVFNLAINTTLSRTLITSGTVIAVVGLLFLFGGSAIKGFAFGMLVGMIFGTYSSIFIASAIVVDLTREDVLEAAKGTPAPAPKAESAKATAK